MLSRAGSYTIWISCGLLAVSLCLMFIREEEELHELQDPRDGQGR